MPDGSRHAAYKKINTSYFITKDYWLLDIVLIPPVLMLTNGTKIYYGQIGPPHPDYPAYIAYYATKIQDVNGNEINIYYQSAGSNLISYVIDSVGRRVNFTTTAINSATRLVSISGPGVSISYTHKSLPTQGHTVLAEARPPVGNPWKYTYNESLFWLTQITTPSGGVINYTYSVVNVNMGFPFYYWAITKKATSGTIPSGTWTFAYSQGPYKDYTQISDPCGRTIKYSYYGYGSGLPNGSMWMIGLPKSKEIVGEETVTYDWAKSSAISQDDYKAAYIGIDTEIYVPLLTRKSITRDGKTYITNYSNYDGYANPQSISEAGDRTRNRSLTYWYNTSKNIVRNKPSSETVSGGFPGTFTTNYSYDSNTGNLFQVNQYGKVTNYTYYSNGNLRTKADANGNTTTFEWSNGKVSKITNPLYSITRIINPNGTIASETNGRGFTTSYTYDGNLRLTRITPPVGNPTIFTYPADNSYKDETRGGFNIRHYNDGFGRPTGTVDSKGINTSIVYKACGPKSYSASNIGDTLYYDNFGRITQILHKDNTKITYAYSQSNVSVTDEASHTTLLTYHAFGNPEEKLLVSVRDALNNTTSYNYNILGSLTNITQDSLSRAFSYNSKNFLISETHPEKGTITYVRDNVGNMTSKTDGLGTTSYTYDALHRLLSINYGTGTITFTYDNADNRTSMTNPSAVIGYEYDSANRLTRKTETIRGRAYYTDYRYDGNDNLTDIYYPPSGYPSGRRVQYTYNSNNQVISIPGFVTNVNYYTSGTSTGLPTNITYANNIATSFSYNLRNLTTQINGGSALNIGYGYADNRGNMTSISNYLDTSKTRHLLMMR